MGKAPAFQFYAAEYLADEGVQLLTLEQEGAYIRLLAYCWREGSIPSDPAKLSRLCKSASIETLSDVLGLFIPGETGRLLHQRLEDERIKQAEYRKKQSQNGGKGGRPPKQNPDDTQAKGLGLFGETQTKAKKRSSSAFASSSSTAIESKEQNLSREKREGDPRHAECREVITSYWNRHTSLAMPWGAEEQGQLGRFLRANHQLTCEGFARLVGNRENSRNVNHGVRPMAWISKLAEYANGALNEFNKPIGGEHGGNKGKTASSVNAARAAIKAIENRATADAARITAANQLSDGGLSNLC
jgi:uncharacterized protein YdaU (DUF1376 family)